MTDAVQKLVRVEVLAEAIIEGRSGVKDGRAWVIPPKQACAIWQDELFPTRLEVPVPDSGPYKPGMYLLAGRPLKVAAANNRVVVSFDDRAVQLVPLEEAFASLGGKGPLKAVANG